MRVCYSRIGAFAETEIVENIVENKLADRDVQANLYITKIFCINVSVIVLVSFVIDASLT